MRKPQDPQDVLVIDETNVYVPPPPPPEFVRWIDARVKLRKRNPRVASFLEDARNSGDPELWDRTARRTVQSASEVGTAVVLAAAARLFATKPKSASRRVWKDLHRTMEVAMRGALVEFIERNGPTHPSVDELAATIPDLAPMVAEVRSVVMQ